MADSTIANLTALTSVATGDLVPITDISDTTDSTGGTTKKVTLQNLLGIWTKETPSGSFNGVNVTYTLAHTPESNTLTLVLNGQVLNEGTDYSVSGTTVTLTGAIPDGYTGPFKAQYLYKS